eukprot:1754231-Rhodomonas_salina.1
MQRVPGGSLRAVLVRLSVDSHSEISEASLWYRAWGERTRWGREEGKGRDRGEAGRVGKRERGRDDMREGGSEREGAQEGESGNGRSQRVQRVVGHAGTGKRGLCGTSPGESGEGRVSA